jgi:type II secretory pathway pseudopilin PulG
MRRSDHGFTFVWALAAVAVVSASLAATGPMWADQAQREREQDLIRIGSLYAEAITSYAQASPGSVKQYPASIDELLLDTRHLALRRHLRAAYTDPMQPSRPWGLVRDAQGRIRGVFSTSTARPFTEQPGVMRYADWMFLAQEIR